MEAEIEQAVGYIGVAIDSAAATDGVWVFGMGEWYLCMFHCNI